MEIDFAQLDRFYSQIAQEAVSSRTYRSLMVIDCASEIAALRISSEMQHEHRHRFPAVRKLATGGWCYTYDHCMDLAA